MIMMMMTMMKMSRRRTSRAVAPRARRLVNSVGRVGANSTALTPLRFLDRAAGVFGSSTAIVDGAVERSWAETRARCVALAAGIRARGLGRGDVVHVLLKNSAEMVEAHFGVPMSGTTLGCMNTRLDAATVAYMCDHSGSRLLIADAEFAPLVRAACLQLDRPPEVVLVGGVDAAATAGAAVEDHFVDYEGLLVTGEAAAGSDPPPDSPEGEWDTVALNYTSGTTGRPKGVLLHHRGLYLTALGNTLAFQGGMAPGAGTRYLWTLPMFHCNGWGFPYTLAALGAVNHCLRDVRVDALRDAFERHHITHLCGAPVVLAMAIQAAKQATTNHQIQMMVAGAPPPAAVLREAQEANILVSHTYGLTEVYGPAAVCQPHAAWAEKPAEEQARLAARQGVPYVTQDEMEVLDRETGAPTPADGVTMGEVAFRGNMVMKGYFRDPAATAAALTRCGTWFKTGDLGVKDADGYIAIKDRAKDIVITGGENVSTVEVESALMFHQAVAECAVVARPDPKWGETPCAFVVLRPGAAASASDLQAFCRTRLAGFQIPKTLVLVKNLPRTSTGKVLKHVLRDRAKNLADGTHPQRDAPPPGGGHHDGADGDRTSSSSSSSSSAAAEH